MGKTQAGTLVLPIDINVWTFAGAVGEQVLVRVRPTSSMEANVRVVRPDGSVLCSTFRVDSGTLELATCVVDQAGSHFILVSDTSTDEAGTYNLLLQRFNPPVNATTITFGETLSGVIDLPLDVDPYSFNGTIGDQVQLTMTRTLGGIDPQIRTYRPDGSNIPGCSSSTTGSVLVVSCTLDASGDHGILLSDSGGDETGNYDLTLELLNGSPLTSESSGPSLLEEGGIESTASPTLAPSDSLTQSGTPTEQGRPSVQVTAINGSAIETGRSGRIQIAASDFDDSRMLTVELAATNVPLDTSIRIYLYPKGKRKDRQVFEAASLTGTLAHSTSITTLTLPENFLEGSLRVVIRDVSFQQKRHLRR